MKLIPVESSNIKAVGYDPQTKEMMIMFRNGAVYSHTGVSGVDHAKLIASPSKGKHYHENFRGRFGAVKITDASPI